MTKPLLQRIGIAIIAAFIVVWLYPHLKSHQFIYEEGRPWNYAQLIAPFDIPIHPDSATLRIARDTLDARFVPIYTLDAHVVDTIIGLLPDPGSDYNRRAARILRRGYERGVVDLPTMTKIRAGELPRIRILEKNVLSEMSAANLTSPRDIYLLIDSTTTDPGLRAYFMAANVHGLLRANIVYDSVETARHYDNEYQTMTADRGVIVQGQAIINKGDIISAQDFTNLKTYETMMEDRVTSDSQSNLLMFLGQLFYAALLLALVMIYLHIFTPRVYDSLRSFTFIIALMVLFFVISVGLTAFIPGGIYIVPLTVLPILVLAFFDGRTAIAVSMATVLLIAPITSFALEFIFLQMCATSAAVFSLQELSRRSQLLRASAVVAVTYIVAYLALELLMNGTFEGFTWRMPAFLLTNALLTSTAYILMFAAERVFGFVSVVTLGELADINQPLLRELSDKCPGTFQHSMSVSNLVTDAARAMGADVQLVRAGALYHDIGKMTNPAFFTENQHGVNPHDTLSPAHSDRSRHRGPAQGRQVFAAGGSARLHTPAPRCRQGQILLFPGLQPGPRGYCGRPHSVHLSRAQSAYTRDVAADDGRCRRGGLTLAHRLLAQEHIGSGRQNHRRADRRGAAFRLHTGNARHTADQGGICQASHDYLPHPRGLPRGARRRQALRAIIGPNLR